VIVTFSCYKCYQTSRNKGIKTTE